MNGWQALVDVVGIIGGVTALCFFFWCMIKGN